MKMLKEDKRMRRLGVLKKRMEALNMMKGGMIAKERELGVYGEKLANRKLGWKPEQGGEKGGCGRAYPTPTE